ncbi:acetylornithine deacetylase [Cordyceps fumosorosea ARSEF 2679]|uniref:Acetylornithine deacetylase n=1 Tax=Cordyceps fumosorosea (strain ARSEF 2679) TaxID=1081104 RepID=A0A167SU53_CORFA|nr:acetylornithine deacetylase [Cordyceps fumosorosea ARSEF 2679]OAA59930.1 acetylornithine deacetylase [Cordyceps fumosorosea ARSEF 2679]
MRLLPIVAALTGLPAALCLQEQAPLNRGHGKLDGAADKHAPPYRKALLDLHRNLVSIPSVSGAEFDVGQWLVDYLISRGFRADVQFVAPREGTPEGAQRFNPHRRGFVVGEEVAGDGMITFSDAALARGEPAPWHSVIFGEPTESKLVCGHKGALFCEIKVAGQAAHSGYPWLGKSANEMLVRAVARILETDLGSSEQYGNTTFNLGLMEGGVAANVVAASATAKFGARVAIGPEKDGHLIVKKRIQAILDEVDKDAFEITCNPGYGTVDCNCDVEGFETLTVNYGTDVANLKGNFTRYLYGPGSILVAHGENEALTVGDLELAVENYEKLILHALNKKS